MPSSKMVSPPATKKRRQPSSSGRRRALFESKSKPTKTIGKPKAQPKSKAAENKSKPKPAAVEEDPKCKDNRLIKMHFGITDEEIIDQENEDGESLRSEFLRVRAEMDERGLSKFPTREMNEIKTKFLAGIAGGAVPDKLVSQNKKDDAII